MSANQYVLLNLLIELLQSQKQVRIERLAANLPIPIQFESSRRQIQRFFISPKLTISSIWDGIITYLLMNYFSTSKELIVVVDRTQWRELNLLMVSIIWHQRAIPLSSQFLSDKGNSNITEQQAVIQPLLLLLQGYKVTVLGDREFCSIALAQWLKNQELSLCLRLRRSEYLRRQDEFIQQLQQLGLKPGMSMFFAGENVTKQLGFTQFNVACKWQRHYRHNHPKSGWFILTFNNYSGCYGYL